MPTNWKAGVSYAAMSIAVLGIGYGIGSCGKGVNRVIEVEFPGKEQGLIVERPFGDLPFVRVEDGTYVQYTEDVLMKRASPREER